MCDYHIRGSELIECYLNILLCKKTSMSSAAPTGLKGHAAILTQ